MEKAPGSDPGSSHNVALVRFNTKLDSEKADTAALSTAMRKEGLPLKTFVHVNGEMSVPLGEADLQARSETDRKGVYDLRGHMGCSDGRSTRTARP